MFQLKARGISFLIISFAFTASLGISTLRAQQDILTTQHIFNKYYINPAHAGKDVNIQATGFFRSRWTGVTSAPMAYMLSVDSSIPKHPKAGVGMIVGNQSSGPFTTIFGYGDFSYYINLSSTSSLRLGVGLGISQYSLDGTKLNSGPIDDPHVPHTKISMIIPDTRIGILYETNKVIFLGLSLDNLISPFMNYKKDPKMILPKKTTNIYAYGGYTINVGKISNKDFIIKPLVMISRRFDNTPVWIEGTINSIYTGIISGGISYRTYIQTANVQFSVGSSVSAFIEVLSIKNATIGYAFDIGVGNEHLNKGSHEIFLKYKFNWPSIVEDDNTGNSGSQKAL